MKARAFLLCCVVGMWVFLTGCGFRLGAKDLGVSWVIERPGDSARVLEEPGSG